jgi:hypothetical protein
MHKYGAQVHKLSKIQKFTEMVKIPENKEELMNYDLEDPKCYKITKNLRFYLNALKVYGGRNMADVKRRETHILKRHELFKKKNRSKLDSPNMLKYTSGVALIR